MYRHTPHYFLIPGSAMEVQDLRRKVADKVVNRYLLEADQAVDVSDFNVKAVVLGTNAKLNIFQLSEAFLTLASETLGIQPQAAPETQEEGNQPDTKDPA